VILIPTTMMGAVPVRHHPVRRGAPAHAPPISPASASASGAVREIYRVLLQGKRAAGLPEAGDIDFLPFGLTACRTGLQAIIDYALQQSLIPRKIAVENLFDDTTRRLEG
jgi:4,5-dihydroxyphthalate decarboxylase